MWLCPVWIRLHPCVCGHCLVLRALDYNSWCSQRLLRTCVWCLENNSQCLSNLLDNEDISVQVFYCLSQQVKNRVLKLFFLIPENSYGCDSFYSHTPNFIQICFGSCRPIGFGHPWLSTPVPGEYTLLPHINDHKTSVTLGDSTLPLQIKAFWPAVFAVAVPELRVLFFPYEGCLEWHQTRALEFFLTAVEFLIWEMARFSFRISVLRTKMLRGLLTHSVRIFRSGRWNLCISIWNVCNSFSY